VQGGDGGACPAVNRPGRYYHTDPRIEPDPARWRTALIIPYRAGTPVTNGS
jgi:hypothetical protein